MFKVIIGLDQFKHAFNNSFVDNTTVFLYTNNVKENETSKLVLRAIDKGFNSYEITGLIDLLATKRIACIRDIDIYAGSNDNYGGFTRESFIKSQIEAGRFESDASRCFDIIESLSTIR